MQFPLQYSVFVTLFCILIFGYYIFKGYRNGFILEVIITLSLLVTIFLSWFLSSVCSSLFMIASKVVDTNSPIDKVVLTSTNRWLWFFILFIGMNIILRLIRLLVRQLNHIPLFGTLNRIAGAILAGIKALLYIIVIIVVFSSPMVANGKEVLSRAGLDPLKDIIEAYVPIAKDVLHTFDI